MGSKITRALNQNQRRQAVKKQFVPTIIKGFMYGLSLLSSFSMGYIINAHYNKQKFDNLIVQAFISTLIVSIFSFVKLNHILTKTVIIVLISLLFWNIFDLVIIGGIALISISIFVIMFGQIFQLNGGPLFFLIFYIVFGLGNLVASKVKLHSNANSPLSIQIVFGVLLLMSIFLFVKSMFYTKTKHPMPLPIKYYFQAVKIYRNTLYYGAIGILISICYQFPSLTIFFDQLKSINSNNNIMGIQIQLGLCLIINILYLKFQMTKFLYIICSLIILLIDGKQFGWFYLGWSLMILDQGMRCNKILGMRKGMRQMFDIQNCKYEWIIRLIIVVYGGMIWMVKQFQNNKLRNKNVTKNHKHHCKHKNTNDYQVENGYIRVNNNVVQNE